MRKVWSYLIPIWIAIVLVSTASCTHIKYNITGRVIDAETQKPIEGVAVAVHWYSHKLIPRCLGIGSGYYPIATYDTVTDANGNFEITEHLNAECQVGVYKQGYIYWDNEYTFYPEEAKYLDWGKARKKRIAMRHGMIISLFPFRPQSENDKYKHADFVAGNSDGLGSLFNKAIEPEIILHYKNVENKKRNHKRK